MPRLPKAFLVALAALIITATAVWAAQPTAYTPATDFSDFSASNPDTPHNGTNMDAEFSAIKLTTDAIRTNLALIQRDDGEIANRTIGYEQLTNDLAEALGVAEVWATATAYTVNDYVFHNNAVYACATAHTSGTFATDLAAAKWTVIIDYSSAVLSATSTTSLAIGTGTKTFTTQSGKYFAAGDYVLIVSDANPSTNYMFGTVTSYSGTSLATSISVTGGSGTLTDWTIRVSGPRGAQGATGSLDFSALSAETTLDMTNDQFVVFDASEAGGTNNKITPQGLFNNLTTLTAETAPATADELAMYDASGTATDKITLANMLKVVGLLTEETSVAADDSVLVYDSSAGTADRATLSSIFSVVNALTEDTAPDVTADFIPTYDTSATGPKKVLFSSLLKGINDLTADASPDTAADYVATYDASAAAAKKVLLSTLASSTGQLAGVQFFTSSGTWTKETGATKALVFVVGGGGGGGGGDGAAAGSGSGGGGGGGGTAIEWITSGLGSTETITIGAGGTAGSTTGGNGGTGGTSSFGAHNSVTGGAGGIGSTSGGTNDNAVTLGGAGGVGSGGSVNLAGGTGTNGITDNDATIAYANAGTGGSSIFGGGGKGASVLTTATSAGTAGGNYGGGGGGGAAATNATGVAGGAGAGGMIMVLSFK